MTENNMIYAVWLFLTKDIFEDDTVQKKAFRILSYLIWKYRKIDSIDDFWQVVFIAIHKKKAALKNLQETDRIAHTITIADSAMVDHIRSLLGRDRQKCFLVYQDEPEISKISDRGQWCEQLINGINIAQQVEIVVRLAMKHLSARQAEVLLYILTNGYSQQGIAEMLGKTESAVSHRMSGAVNGIKKF